MELLQEIELFIGDANVAKDFEWLVLSRTMQIICVCLGSMVTESANERTFVGGI